MLETAAAELTKGIRSLASYMDAHQTLCLDFTVLGINVVGRPVHLRLIAFHCMNALGRVLSAIV